MARDTDDEVALILVVVVGVFVVVSLALLIGLAFVGKPSANGWSGLLTLLTATVGAVGGWWAGKAVRRRDPPEDT